MINILLFLTCLVIIIFSLSIYFKSQYFKAKKICKIYKHLENKQKHIDEIELLKITSVFYFRTLMWNDFQIENTLKLIFNSKNPYNKNIDLKDLISAILTFENPKIIVKELDQTKIKSKELKKKNDIERAYNKIIIK